MSTPSEESNNNTVFLIIAAVVAAVALLYLCRDTTPNVVGLTVEQAKKKLKDSKITLGEKIGFVDPTEGNQLGKIAEQQVVDTESGKKINYKMYQIDVNNIDEYARVAKEKAKQSRQMALMQAELERAMRAMPPPVEAPPPEPVEPEPEPTTPPPPPPPPQPKRRRVVDMGFGSMGLAVRR
jgi:hypothetical protein